MRCNASRVSGIFVANSASMKRYLSMMIWLLLPVMMFAQAYEGKVDYDKKKHDAFIIEYPYPPEAVENAIVAKMEKLGYSGKEEKGIFNKDKGFRKFKNAYITEIHDRGHDYIIKVEPKSKKQDDKSVVYMIMLKEDANAMAGMDASEISKAKSFLTGLLPHIEAANLELLIIAQEEVIAKAEKKLKNLQDDKIEMEDKIKKLQDNIATNVKDQESTTKDIENQRVQLENLKKKRVQ
jgi:hypothetical protein